MKYKVWIQIEEVDDDSDHYENVTEPEELAAFDTQEEAENFVESLRENRNTPSI